MKGGRNGKQALDANPLERVKGVYFAYFPKGDKDKAWQKCITAINTHFRGRAYRKIS